MKATTNSVSKANDLCHFACENINLNITLGYRLEHF